MTHYKVIASEEFRKIARIAFQGTPQVLETFGIKVLSSKKKPKAATQL